MPPSVPFCRTRHFAIEAGYGAVSDVDTAAIVPEAQVLKAVFRGLVSALFQMLEA